MSFLSRLLGRQRREEKPDVDVLELAERRVARNPQNPEARYELGSIYYVRGRLEEAVKELREAVRLAPELDHAHYLLGLAYRQLGRVEEARQAFQNAAAHSGNRMLQDYAQRQLQALDKLGAAQPA